MDRLLRTQTERLLIRPYHESDLQESFQLMQDEELFTYLHFGVMTFDEYKGLFGWLIQSYESQEQDDFKYSFAVCLRSTGQMIGWVGVGNLDLMKYSFTTLGLQRIVAKVAPGNAASKRIIEKAGFIFEQVLSGLPEEHTKCNGELLFSLTSEVIPKEDEV